MCNLYSFRRSRAEVARLFRITDNRVPAELPDLPAIFPGHVAPIVRADDDGRELVMMRWGFPRLQPGRAPRPVTNTRDDNVRSPFWRDSVAHRRCLVPASSFCEPNGDVSPATWHWFALVGDEARPMFAFAGIWRHYRGPVRKDGPAIETDVFSFLTTTPNNLVETINHERMPVLLTRDDEFETWLRGGVDEALALARELPPDRMRIVQEGLEKQDLNAG